MAGAPALQFFPWPDVDAGESKLAQADKHTNAGMLRERFNYYCEKVVKGFIKITSCALTARLCWWIACSRSTAGHRRLTICVWR
jgi:predicted YcjX-like family ATPase